MYDEWNEFIGILANAISKHIDEMELDALPDPEPIEDTKMVDTKNKKQTRYQTDKSAVL